MEGAVPEAADKVNQDWVLLAVQFSAPPPEFVTVMFFAAGFEPSAVAEKITDVLETFKAGDGGAAAIFNVIFTVCGDPSAPDAETVTVSL